MLITVIKKEEKKNHGKNWTKQQKEKGEKVVKIGEKDAIEKT